MENLKQLTNEMNDTDAMTEDALQEDLADALITSEDNNLNGTEIESPISVYKLHDAAQRFDVKEIDDLIATGYDVNEQYKAGYNAIHTMLQTYVDLNLVGQINVKPKFIEILSLVARNGIDINSVDFNKQTALHFISAQGNYVDIIKPLLAAGMRVNIQDNKSQTALHAAILKGHVNNVQALVEGGADTDIEDSKGETALHKLCKGKRKLNLVQLLIRCGASVNSRDLGKRTPLHVACKNSRKELVRELLIGGAKVTAKDATGQTPLHYAAKWDMTGAVAAVLLDCRKSEKSVNLPDFITDETPLHKTIKYGTVEVFKLLVQHNPSANPNIKDALGETALHRAAGCRDIYIWKELLKLGGDVNIVNDSGYTPVQKALRMKNNVALSLMREHGAYFSNLS